jgi:hypothetical protein
MKIVHLVLASCWSVALFAAPLPLTSFERYEGDASTETKKIQALAGKFAFLQTAVGAATGGNKRGTHAKGTCLSGEIELYEQTENLFKKGPFGKWVKVPASIRFANASSTIQEDFVPDVRSISFAFSVEGLRFDLSMNNDPVFTFGLLEDFNNFMSFALQSKTFGNTKEEREKNQKAFFTANPDIYQSVVRTEALGNLQKNKNVSNYFTEAYYTGSAYLFGTKNAAKFRLDPCDGVDRSEPLKGKERVKTDTSYAEIKDFLQTRLATAVKDTPEKICFILSVELLDADKMKLPENLQIWEKLDSTLKAGETAQPWQWVEYATLNWSEAREKAGLGKPIQLGKLTAVRDSMKSSKDCDDVKNAFNVNGNSFEDVRPIGRINRGRSPVEAQSARLRKQ